MSNTMPDNWSASDPMVSMIVPLYNVSSYLRDTIPTYLNQTYANIEFILVDDESPDESGRIAEEFAAKDPRIKVVHREENGGLSAARNTGLDIAQGEYITFVDSDDTIVPNMVEKCVHDLQATDSDICCLSFFRICANGDRFKRGSGAYGVTDAAGALRRWFHEDGVLTGATTKVVKRDLIERSHIRFVEGETNEDVMYTAEIMANADKVVFCGETLYEYWEREDSITTTLDPKKLQLAIVHCDQLLEYVRQRFPELEDDCLFYRASVIGGWLIGFALSGNADMRDIRSFALDDVQRYSHAYRRFFGSIPLGSIRYQLVKHGFDGQMVQNAFGVLSKVRRKIVGVMNR